MEAISKEMLNAFNNQVTGVKAYPRINKKKEITGINIPGESIIERFCVKINKYDNTKADLQLNKSDNCVASDWERFRKILHSKKILHKETNFQSGDEWYTAIEIKGIPTDKWISLYKTISDILKSFVDTDTDTEIEQSTVPNLSMFPVLSSSNEIEAITESATEPATESSIESVTETIIIEPVTKQVTETIIIEPATETIIIESATESAIESATQSVVESATQSVVDKIIIEPVIEPIIELVTVETSNLQTSIMEQPLQNEIYGQTAAQYYYSLMVSISMQHISDCINIPTYINSAFYHIRMKDFKIAENAYLQYYKQI